MKESIYTNKKQKVRFRWEDMRELEYVCAELANYEWKKYHERQVFRCVKVKEC